MTTLNKHNFPIPNITYSFKVVFEKDFIISGTCEYVEVDINDYNRNHSFIFFTNGMYTIDDETSILEKLDEYKVIYNANDFEIIKNEANSILDVIRKGIVFKTNLAGAPVLVRVKILTINKYNHYIKEGEGALMSDEIYKFVN